MLGDESFGLVERLSVHISLNIPRCYHEDAESETELRSLVSAQVSLSPSFQEASCLCFSPHHKHAWNKNACHYIHSF